MAAIEERDDGANSPAFELASRQASLAFTRTLVSIDQSLMSAIRTSLSLIAFGFAMAWFLHRMSGSVGVDLRTPARNFGFSLIAMGVALITIGLVENHRRFAELKSQMDDLYRRKLLPQPCPHQRSSIAVLAGFLLLSGILAMLGVAIRVGPFG
jgi:putative membrane protein